MEGRTRAQMYKGEADWKPIEAVKNNPRMHIPIFGNGDVDSPERAMEMRDRYGLDGAMIGRASIGNPWFFNEVKHYFETGEHKPTASIKERAAIAKRFNEAVASGKLEGPVVISRDHHDVSGTDSPFRETSNIYDGSAFTADMAVQNCIGDSFRYQIV